MVQVLVPSLGTSTLREERVMKKTNAQLLQRINLYLNSVDYLKNTTWMYVYCYVYSLPLCYFTQSALPNQTGCCSVLHVLLCPAKRIKRAAICLCSCDAP